MTARPSVLFVRVHNAGCNPCGSRVAGELAEDRIEVRSAGSAPAHHMVFQSVVPPGK